MNFLFAQNKLGVIEQETRKEYIAYQYLIKNGWTIYVSKNPNPGPDAPTWILKRLGNSGEKIPMKGFKKTYFDDNAVNPKIYD